MMATMDLSKTYDKQTDTVKQMLSEGDYKEIRNLLYFKKSLTQKAKEKVVKKLPVNPIDINNTLDMIHGWSENLKARSMDGKANWIAIVESSDISKLEMKVICGSKNHPATMKCAGFQKSEIIEYIDMIYDKGGYIESITL